MYAASRIHGTQASRFVKRAAGIDKHRGVSECMRNKTRRRIDCVDFTFGLPVYVSLFLSLCFSLASRPLPTFLLCPETPPLSLKILLVYENLTGWNSF